MGDQYDRTLTCPECGGTCHLLTVPGPEDEIEDGDVLAYRCTDCADRLDIVVGDEGGSEAQAPPKQAW